jgi:hypothetical protein
VATRAEQLAVQPSESASSGRKETAAET